MLALAFALFLFAQAGVPLTSGFFAKFYVITAAVEAGSTWLAIIAMLTAVVAAFLYLRIIVSMYMSVEDAGEPRTIRVPFAAGLALAICAAVTLGVGLFPGPLSSTAEDATPVLVLEPVDDRRAPTPHRRRSRSGERNADPAGRRSTRSWPGPRWSTDDGAHPRPRHAGRLAARARRTCAARGPDPYHRWLPGRRPRRRPPASPAARRHPSMLLSSTTLPDVELVELARSGDRSAFDELLRRHDGRMRGLAYKLMADRHRMDDALQEAYLKAYRALPRFRPGSDFGTWLYRITYNACIDELRKRKRHPVTTEDPVDPVSGRPGPERVVSASETVRRALADLPVDQRVTVVLVDGEGFDHREAAKILGVAPGTVASRLHRARAALRRILGEEVR